jgi:hypothetical protein
MAERAEAWEPGWVPEPDPQYVDPEFFAFLAAVTVKEDLNFAFWPDDPDQP